MGRPCEHPNCFFLKKQTNPNGHRGGKFTAVDLEVLPISTFVCYLLFSGKESCEREVALLIFGWFSHLTCLTASHGK
eukprot:SAG31_NODE_827_length_11749_cov_14.363090_10_plen_77_part_00